MTCSVRYEKGRDRNRDGFGGAKAASIDADLTDERLFGTTAPSGWCCGGGGGAVVVIVACDRE